MMQLIWAIDKERPQHFLTCQSKSYNPGMNVPTAVISPNHRFLSQSLREISKIKNHDLRQMRSPILQVNVKQILYIMLGIASGYLCSDPRTSYSRWESWISEHICLPVLGTCGDQKTLLTGVLLLKPVFWDDGTLNVIIPLAYETGSPEVPSMILQTQSSELSFNTPCFTLSSRSFSFP